MIQRIMDFTFPMWGLVLFAAIVASVWFPKAWKQATQADEEEARREEERWVIPIRRPHPRRYNESNARFPFGGEQ